MQQRSCAGAATVSCVDHTQQRRRGPDGRNWARCEQAQLLRCRQLHSPRSAGVDTRGPYSYPASSRGQRTACSLPTRRRPGTGTTPARPARARRRECPTCTTGPLPSAAPWVPVPWVIGPTVAAAWRARERQGPRAAVRHTCSGRSRALRESARCRTPGSAGIRTDAYRPGNASRLRRRPRDQRPLPRCHLHRTRRSYRPSCCAARRCGSPLPHWRQARSPVRPPHLNQAVRFDLGCAVHDLGRRERCCPPV